MEDNQEMLTNHEGKWVAIGVEGLLSVSDSISEASEEARSKGVWYPLLFKVPDTQPVDGLLF